MSLGKFILFLDHWQTLLGIIFGAIVAMLSFYLKDKYNNFYDRIEARRRIEVSLTRSLNDLHNTKKSLNEFLERLTGVINQTKDDLADDTKYAFHETNLPVLRVYVDNTLAEIRTSSYYVHNKLLRIDSILEIMNSTLFELREDLNSLIRSNQFLVGLRPSPREQKNSYIANLESFKDLIQDDLIGKIFQVHLKF